MNDKPIAGELWMRVGREEYYFINSISQRSKEFNSIEIVHFTVIRDGENFDADTDMPNFISATKRANR